MTLGLKKPMRVMALVNHRHSLAVATERADLRRVDGQCPVGVIRNGAFRLQRIPMSATPPIATKELQRRNWSRWANKRQRRLDKIAHHA
jgi:hypothetical protein